MLNANTNSNTNSNTNINTVDKWPSEAQVKAAVIKIEKIIKSWIETNEITYEQLDTNILTITFKPSWSDKEFTMLYSYTFKNFERHTRRFLFSGFLDAKNEELKIDFLK